MGSITTGNALALAAALALTACARPYVSPVAPPPYRAEISAACDVTWAALIRALARQNVPLRAVARDSGVLASDDILAPIGLYADSGRIGDERLEGEALVSFTVFAEPNGIATRLQVNSAMRTHAHHRRGGSGTLRPVPCYACVSTGRFEANLLDAARGVVAE